MNRVKSAVVVGVLAVALVAAFLIGRALEPDTAYAATDVYNVARGVETDATHWLGGVPSRGIGGLKIQVGTVTFDNSYARGGETVDLSGTFPNHVLACILAAKKAYSVDDTDYCHVFEYVHASSSAPATGKVKVYIDGLEVANAANLQHLVVDFIAIGD